MINFNKARDSDVVQEYLYLCKAKTFLSLCWATACVFFHPSPCIVTVCACVCVNNQCAFLRAEIRIFVQFVLRSYLCLCARANVHVQVCVMCVCVYVRTCFFPD